jgi:tRNA/rRNA methyltransferase
MTPFDCRVVLVRPQFAGNVGATARVMRNMGLEQLVLVAPEASLDDRQARQLSTHGEEILDRARIVADLGEAVADCVLVVGTSARTGKLIRGQSGPPEAIMPHVVAALQGGPTALVFGPETNGLTNAEIARCHHLIHIPADPGYAALNLAQAVAICLYVLRREWSTAGQPTDVHTPAEFAEQERMFEHLRGALEEIHFLYGPKAEPLMHALRHMIGRAQPTEMEVGVLFGLARQIRWFASQKSEPPG